MALHANFPAASRAKLHERKSAKFTGQYEDYLHLGYLEWQKVYDEFEKLGRKAILFVMTDDTRNCDEVKEYLESRYSKLKDAVLVIHTKNNGEISEASSGKSKEELDKLRRDSRVIASLESRYKAINALTVQDCGSTQIRDTINLGYRDERKGRPGRPAKVGAVATVVRRRNGA